MFSSPKLRNPYKEDHGLPICSPIPVTGDNRSFWTVKRITWTLLLALLVGCGMYNTTVSDALQSLDENEGGVQKYGDGAQSDPTYHRPIEIDNTYPDSQHRPTEPPEVPTNEEIRGGGETYEPEVQSVTPPPAPGKTLEVPLVTSPSADPINPPSKPSHPHPKHSLKTTLLKDVVLWLDSADGATIAASPSTVAWSDGNINKEKYDFTSMSPKAATSNHYSQKFKDAVKDTVKDDPANPSNSYLESLSFSDKSYIPEISSGTPSSITFPPPLQTPTFSLPREATVFFVVTPEYLGSKSDNFQTFFSIGPSKFMFRHGKVTFSTKDSNDVVVPSALRGSKGHIKKGSRHLVAYKFQREAPSMSLDGSPFEVGDGHTKNAGQAFVGNVKAYLGGGGPTDGFVGKVEEVMIFKKALGDGDASEVINHLAGKWQIDGMEDDIYLESARPLDPIGADDDGGEVDEIDDRESIDAQIKFAEMKKKEEAEKMKNKFDPANRSDNTKRLDEIHAKAIEESIRKSEEEVKLRQEEAQKDMGDPIDQLYTVAKAHEHKPGPCKGAGDAFKGVPLKVWEKDKDDNISQVDWLPPLTADLKEINEWEEGHAASDKAIKAYKGGGEGLKEIVHKEAKKLQELRHALFCKKKKQPPSGGEGDF